MQQAKEMARRLGVVRSPVSIDQRNAQVETELPEVVAGGRRQQDGREFDRVIGRALKMDTRCPQKSQVERGVVGDHGADLAADKGTQLGQQPIQRRGGCDIVVVNPCDLGDPRRDCPQWVDQAAEAGQNPVAGEFDSPNFDDALLAGVEASGLQI